MSEGDGADAVVLSGSAPQRDPAGGGGVSQGDRVAGSVNTSKHTRKHTANPTAATQKAG